MKPTHRLKILDKSDNSRGEVGAGWLNPDGSISIVLNPGTMLTRRKDHVITLFPEGEKPEFVPIPSGFKMSEERRKSVEHPITKQMKEATKKGPVGIDPNEEF